MATAPTVLKDGFGLGSLDVFTSTSTGTSAPPGRNHSSANDAAVPPSSITTRDPVEETSPLQNFSGLSITSSEFREIAGSLPVSPKHKPRLSCDRRAVGETSLQPTTTSLHEATLQDDPELVRQLLSSGASANEPIWCDDPDGDVFVTLLHILSSRPDLPNTTKIIVDLIRARANQNARSSLGTTPLARACLHKHVGAAEYLLEVCADIKPVDDRGRNALHCAVSLEFKSDSMTLSTNESLSGHLVSLLASRGSDLDDGGAVPPLLEAIRQTNRPAVSALISNGATPRFLHVAVSQAPACIIEDLLAGHTCPFEEDIDGKTVLDIAFQRGDEEITTLLRDHIGDIQRRNVSKYAHSTSRPRSSSSVCKTSTALSAQSADEEDNTLGLSSAFMKGRNQNKEDETTCVTRMSSSKIFPFKAPRVLKSTQKKARGTVTFSGGAPRVTKFCNEKCFKLQVVCRWAKRNRNFQFVMFAALLMALFCPDLWILADMEGNLGLDVLLVTVFTLFLAELLVQVIGTPKAYINSFFFWTDVAGLVSVPLDLSMVSDSFPRSFDNAVVMRAVRTARLGARAGRFTKLVKLLRFLPGVVQEPTAHDGTAKSMSNTLMTSLSTRICCLIILMVMVLPLFEMATFPENDFSMKTWMNSLDHTLDNYAFEVLERRINEFETFYEDKDYFPFQISWENADGITVTRRLRGRRPRRDSNQMEINANSNHMHSLFNFGVPYRISALCNIVLIIVIIILMMGFSLLLSNSVAAIVLQPLENLLFGVKQMASKIFQSVVSMAATCSKHSDEKVHSDRDGATDFDNETELLEKVIDKLAALSEITMKKSPIDAETLEQLGESDRAVLQTFSPDEIPAVEKPRTSSASTPKSSQSASSFTFSEHETRTEDLVTTLENFLEQAGLTYRFLDSWEFDALAVNDKQQHLVCLNFLIFHLGLGYSSAQHQCLVNFLETVAAGYNPASKTPYHNWCHAVDVSHCVFKLLGLCCAERLLSNHERYALIVSALCHDIGHSGFSNPFLIETSHELAIRYNDHSPLENMHCAKLFEIISHPKTAVFSTFDKQQYREVRQVCVEAILHTDNIHHFSLVKEMQMLYEMNSDVFDITLQMYQASQIDFPPREVCDLLMEPDKKRQLRNLLLHFSDISNTAKPFPICEKWACLIMNEFFLQGDKEKELGITVQPLNDRDKVNKPYSQVGFIEFFVAPFAFATVRVLPPFAMCTDQMMQNLNSWFEEWINTTTPAPSPDERSKLRDRITKLEAKYVFRDGF